MAPTLLAVSIVLTFDFLVSGYIVTEKAKNGFGRDRLIEKAIILEAAIAFVFAVAALVLNNLG